MVTPTTELELRAASTMMLRRTVTVVDMVGYSSVARLLEDHISAISVADLDLQIQGFVSRSLAKLAEDALYCVAARTGDGIILLFERPDDAHKFGNQLHLAAKEHNDLRSEKTAERWFRIGIVTGDVLATCATGPEQLFAGISIANAVRLEAAAKAGQIVVDVGTFAILSPQNQCFYNAEETINGKRTEKFLVRRCIVTADASTQVEFANPITAFLKPLSAACHISASGSVGGLLTRMTLVLSIIFFAATATLLFSAIRDRLRGILFASSVKHIAVLPLQILPSSPQSQAVADGLVDSLAGQLSNFSSAGHALWIVPSSDVRDHKISDPSSALRVFGATIVLRGSLFRGESETRLQLAVIDPAKGRQIGFVDVVTKTGDLVALQDDAITRLVRLLDLPFSSEKVPTMGGPPVRASYEDYLEGVGYFERQDKPGNIALGISALQRSVVTDPQFALGFARLSQAYLLQYELTSDAKWLTRAQGSADRAAELSRNLAPTYVALAQVHHATGNEDLAIQEYQQALQLDHTNVDALEGWADSLRKQGKTEEAEAVYLERVAIRIDDWAGYNGLGNFYLDVGKADEAIRQFSRGLQVAPDNSWLLIGMGNAYIDLDEPELLEKAEASLKKSIIINPTDVAYYNLSLVYLQLHRFGDSLIASNQALQINPQRAQVWANLASAYQWMNNEADARRARRKAQELFEREIKQNGSNAMAHADLAEIYGKAGETAKARESISISLALSPKDRYVLLEVADAYEAMGERKKAVDYLRQALENKLPLSQLRSDPQIQTVVQEISLPKPAISEKPTIQ